MIGKGMGWLPDLPRIEDYTPDSEEIVPLLQQASVAKAAAPAQLPASVTNLEWWFPRVEDQGSIGSCTANAGVGMVEYFERKAFDKHIDASRLFLYKVTRKLLHWTGDTGAYLRTTMGAMALFGVPPEEYWPYEIDKFDREPPPFCYAFAQSYQAIRYYRLDPVNVSKKDVLNRIKTNLAAGLPSMFGFTVYSSISQADQTGEIPYPARGEAVEGGHAVVAVGYDDGKKMSNNSPNSTQTTGALRIRNSWGAGWGDDGYGWLPYQYVLGGLAEDWWSLVKNEWIDTGQFHLNGG